MLTGTDIREKKLNKYLQKKGIKGNNENEIDPIASGKREKGQESVVNKKIT